MEADDPITMIRIAITPATFEAIAATLPVKGQRLIWLEAAVADRLEAMRGPGESFSNVNLRLAAGLAQ